MYFAKSANRTDWPNGEVFRQESCGVDQSRIDNRTNEEAMTMKRASGFVALFFAFAFALTGTLASQEKADEGRVDVDFPNRDKVDVDVVRKSMKDELKRLAKFADVTLEFAADVQDKPLTAIYRNVVPLDAARSICKPRKLRLWTSEGRWRIENDTDAKDEHVIKGSYDSRFNASFVEHDFIDAINEVAQVAMVDAFVPADPPEKADDRRQNRRNPKVTLCARNATADYLMREIARQTGMQVVFKRESRDGKDVDSYSFTLPKDLNEEK
jgi:hypothetical protein